MTDNNPPRKRYGLGLLQQRHSDHRMSDGESSSRAATESDVSSLAPSQTGSHKGPLRKLLDKVTKSASTRSVGPSNTAGMGSRSSFPDPTINEPSEDPPPALISEPNLGQNANSRDPKVEVHDQQFVKEKIDVASQGLAGTSPVPGAAVTSVINDLQSAPDAMDTFSAMIAPLKVFNSIASGIADIHPYAKAVMSIFTYASNIIIAQADRDNAVHALLEKLSEVYSFMNEDGRLAKIEFMQAIYGKIARQTLECADFITHYSETKSAWGRLAKNVIAETDAKIHDYNNVFEALMQQLRDRAVRDTALNVHHIDRAVDDIDVKVHRIAEDLDFKDMVYVDGAGRDTSKRCLPGTREGILNEIKDWIDETGEDVKRVFWLSGTAGKGKSAIAHTIANWFDERGGPGACFCFDRTREAEQRHEKIFTTIARDLADCDPIMWRALASTARDNELRHTKDIARQWKKFILGPVDAASQAVDAPVLIVIDALDESGQARSREQILHMLAGSVDPFSSELMKLPANLRVLVTSRPLGDIQKSMQGVSHVRHVSMDDISHVSLESSQRDIQIYISLRLNYLRDDEGFDDGHFKMLAHKSDGLFEWARLACEYIKGTDFAGVEPMDRFEDLTAGTSESITGAHLLDDMYTRTLTKLIPMDEKAISRVRSIIAQILGSFEPLSMSALTEMRMCFLDVAGKSNVMRVIEPLGSLFSGTTDSHTPIRPLHASFHDFLTDESRSGKFFVDVSLVKVDLAFASLRVMERGLRFNICSLESSYLPNSAVLDLEDRLKKYIPAELAYSCRFWGAHVRAAPLGRKLVEQVEAFFDTERLLFWIEALALMQGLSGSVATLLSVALWLTGHAEYSDIIGAIRDTQHFIRTFAPAIVHSTPHLYLSALPFAPAESTIFKKFAAKFPGTPRLLTGPIMNWPPMEKVLQGHTNQVWSVAISSDGTRIVSGSEDSTIRVWDAETGKPLGTPIQGHTDQVLSVAISLDGTRIVSGSADKTIRVWDAESGKPLGTPLEGHTDWVLCVAISRDGTRIVSGSEDETIQVWDAETGKALGAPLQGHTDLVVSVAISPDGTRIVSGSEDNTIRVWDAGTGKALGAPLQGHTDFVLSVAISPDGTRIVSGSEDNTIRVWDADTGKALGAPLEGHTGCVWSVAVSPDGTRIVSGSSDSTIRVWDVETGEALGAPLQGHTDRVLSVAILPDGTRIVSGSEDETIRVWDAEVGKALGAPLQGHTDQVMSVAISLDGTRIVSGSSDNTIRVWDAETGEALGAPLQGHTDFVLSVAISPDGTRIVSGSEDKTIWVWDAETGKALGTPLEGHTDWVWSVAISPDGTRVVSGSKDNTIRVWDVETGKALGAPFVGHTDHILCVAISPDGTRIVSGSSDNTIRVWDAETGKALGAPLKGHTDWVWSVAISPDGTRIVSGSEDETIWVWDAETGKPLGAPLQGHTDTIWSVAISPDGTHIVSGSEDKTIRMWDTETGRALGIPLRGHTGQVLSVAISTDGTHIVSGSQDKTIRMWDAETGKALGSPLQRHPGTVQSIIVSPDGAHIVPGSYNQTNQLQVIESFNQFQAKFHGHAICFSSNPIHALRSASSFVLDSSASLPTSESSFVPTKERWILLGQKEDLLLWIPVYLPLNLYNPCTTHVIPIGSGLQLDLSCLAHGISWQMCYEHYINSMSYSPVYLNDDV